MEARAILDDLTARGFTLELIGHRLLVSPAERVNESMRILIREHKAALVEQLRTPPPLTSRDQAAIHEAVEERAAILEHEAHLPRPRAETQAARAMRVYRYRLSDRADWLTLIAPGCGLDEARRVLVSRFGAERVLDIQAHQPFASDGGVNVVNVVNVV